jgi:hypothetical protein
MSTARTGVTGRGLAIESRMYLTSFWRITFAVGEGPLTRPDESECLGRRTLLQPRGEHDVQAAERGVKHAGLDSAEDPEFRLGSVLGHHSLDLGFKFPHIAC